MWGAGFSPAHPSGPLSSTRAMETKRVSYALTMRRRDREPTSSEERIRRSSIVEVPAGPEVRYGPMRRQRVMKELRQGRPLAAEDMPVAAALVRQQRWQRWLAPLWVSLAVSTFLQGLSHHGFMRWAAFALTVGCLVLIPLQLREQRQLIRNYEGQAITPNARALDMEP
jgi:hypothetical protein